MARPARTGIQTAPGEGPELETITRSNGAEIPLVATIAVGAWEYRAGVEGTVAMPDDGRLLSLSCLAGESGATVTIDEGDEIPIPENMGFSVSMDADVFGATIVFDGTVSHFVQYVLEGDA